MVLANVEALGRLPFETWSRLGDHFNQSGLTRERGGRIAALGQGSPDRMANALRAWHLRRETDVAALLMRLFCFHDAVSWSEGRRALGWMEVDGWLACGLLSETGHGLVGTLTLDVVGTRFILSDDLSQGGDAVMGAGPTTRSLIDASAPTRPIESLLDIGCGGGACALVLADRAERVVATDVNPRAVTLGRVNAALNGIRNVEFRVGDLFEPVRGETFDRIVSQPPYVPRPEQTPDAAYLWGGARGDELALRLVQGAPQHLTARGRAVFLVEWPLARGETVEQRVKGAIGKIPMRTLLLQRPPTDLDDACALYSLQDYPEQGARFEQMAHRRREHLAQQGIEELRLAFAMLEKAEGRAAWTSMISIQGQAIAGVAAPKIDRLFLARDALVLGPAAWSHLPLKIPDCEVHTTRTSPLGPATRVRLVYPFDAMVGEVSMTPATCDLFRLIGESPSFGAAIASLAEQWRVPDAAALDKVRSTVEQALLVGLLEFGPAVKADSRELV